MNKFNPKPEDHRKNPPDPDQQEDIPIKILPHYQSLYQERDSLDEVLSYAHHKCPTIDRNLLLSLFMMYHNTLLNLVNDQD